MHPILFQIPTPWGPLVLWSHGACLAAAALAGWYLWVRPAGEVPAERRARIYLAGLGAGLFAGKLLDATLHGGTLLEGGVAPAGVVLGGVFVGWVVGRALDQEARRQAALLVPLFVFFIALGQWLHGAAYGVPFDGPPWLERLGTYPAWDDGAGAPAWLAHRARGWIGPDAQMSLPTHPVQLYEAAGALLVLGLLRWRRPTRALALALAATGAIALAIEPLRAERSVGDSLAPLLLLLLATVGTGADS